MLYTSPICEWRSAPSSLPSPAIIQVFADRGALLVDEVSWFPYAA
jgi:hypothetical protein